MEKTEEQIAKEKSAVDSMRNAQSNMKAVLRVDALECALRRAVDNLRSAKKFVPEHGYVYNGQKSLHSLLDEQADAAARALG